MLCSHCGAHLIAAVIAFALSTAASPARSDDGAVDDSVESIWRVQSLPLEYNSARTHYACDSMKKKVRAILQAVGAHSSTIVTARCVDNGPLNQISLQISAATPVPASEENIRAATTFDARDELLARVRKTTLPTPSDIPRFRATWQTLALSRHPNLQLDVGDCDLLREMNRQVFPKLAVRLTSEKLNCTASATRLRPRFEVQALIPAAPTPTAQVDP